MRTKSLAIAAGIAVLACTAASGQSQLPAPEAAPPNAPSRYSFDRVGDSLLRLDTVNGQITICSQRSAGWVCQAAPEDRAAFETEIARLQGEVAGLKNEITGLKSEIAGLREPPPPRPPAELTPPTEKNDGAQSSDSKLKMPTQEDIERARVAVENAWRRLVDMIVNFKNDVMRKG